MTEYTGYSGDPDLQEGNYLALHAAVDDVSDTTLSVEVIGGHSGPVTLDADGIVVLRIESKEQMVKYTATKAGYETVSQVYDLSGLTLEAKAIR